MRLDRCSNSDCCKDPELIYWIWLTELNGIGPVTQKELLIIFDNPKEIYCANREQLVQCKGIGHYRLSILLESKDLQTANKILKLCETNDINIMTLSDASFPERWKKIKQIPNLFYYKGTLSSRLSQSDIKFVISKELQLYNHDERAALIKTSHSFASSQYLYMGKLEKGMDTLIHSILIKQNVYSCLFLANSPDVCLSKDYEKLYEEVIRNGVVFSTYPPGSIVSFRHIPKRNKLVLLMSDIQLIMP